MNKRQESADRTRRAIVDAAQRLISERGIDSINIEDITKDAGVSKGSFYTYFEHKEDILDEVAYPKFDSILSKARTSGDIWECLASFLMDSIEYISETGVRMCQGWMGRIVDPDDSNGVRKMDYDRSAIASILSEEEDDPKVIWIIREYYGIVMCWAVSDGRTDPVKEMEDFCNGPLKIMMSKEENRWRPLS